MSVDRRLSSLHSSRKYRSSYKKVENKLGHEAVDATNINAFKSKLDRLRYTRMGFFMDQSAEPIGLLVESLLARPHKVSNKVSKKLHRSFHCFATNVTLCRLLLWGHRRS